MQQQQKSDDENNSTSNVGLPVPRNLSELFDEHDSQQLADLLGFLSYNNQKWTHNNTVAVQQEKVYRVGFEPTTAASIFWGCSFYLLSNGDKDNIIILASPPIFQDNHLENL